MTTVTLYICEVCGQCHETEALARACETHDPGPCPVTVGMLARMRGTTRAGRVVAVAVRHGWSDGDPPHVWCALLGSADGPLVRVSALTIVTPENNC